MKRTPQRIYNNILSELLIKFELQIPSNDIKVAINWYNINSDISYNQSNLERNAKKELILRQIKMIEWQLKHRQYKNINDFIEKLDLSLLESDVMPYVN